MMDGAESHPEEDTGMALDDMDESRFRHCRFKRYI